MSTESDIHVQQAISASSGALEKCPNCEMSLLGLSEAVEHFSNFKSCLQHLLIKLFKFSTPDTEDPASLLTSTLLHVSTQPRAGTTWSCYTCDLHFQSRTMLRQHRREVFHSPTRKGSPKKDVVIRDGLTDNTTQWRCHRCSYHFKSRDYLLVHNRGTHLDDLDSSDSSHNASSTTTPTSAKWTCTMCGTATFYTRELLRQHKSAVHNVGRQSSTSSIKSPAPLLSPSASVKEAPSNVDGQRVWCCRYCQQNFSSRNLMRQHKRNTLCRLQTKKQREEAGDPAKRPQFVCQGCQKVFPQSSRLLRHQQSCLVRQKLAEFRCDKCTCTYTSHNLYLQHVALCQKAEITSACNKCGLVRIHPSKLQRHVKTCSGVKKHCQHCHTSFLSINLMDCHEASRVCVDPSDERRILCVKCNKAFDTIVQYLQHQWRDALSHRIIEVVNSPENSSSDEGDGALPLEKLFPVKPTSKRRKLDGENLPVCKCCKQLLLWGDRSHLLNCAQSKFWHRDLPLELLRCPRCDRQFPQAHLLNSHASVCRGVISHCHKCHYYFTSARSLEEHLTHSGCLQSRTFKCIRCDNFEGESLEELWIHRGALTKGNSSIPLCETHHSKVHCKHCGEMFAAKGLAVHVRYCESNAGVNASVPKKIINCSRSAAWLGRLNNCSNGIGCGFCSDWFHDRTQLVEHVATEHTEAMTASQAFVWHHKITMLHFPHAAAHINKKSAAASSCQPVKQEMAHQEGTEEASGNNMDDTTDVQEWYDLDENGEYDYSPYFGDVYGVENIPEEDNGLLKLSFTSDPL